jgi:hypothetical protein
LVFTHNNLFQFRKTLSSNLNVEELNVLLDLFTRYNVEMVVTGHDHEKNASVFGRTTYIQVAALKDGLSNAGYFELTINGNNIEYEFRNI